MCIRVEAISDERCRADRRRPTIRTVLESPTVRVDGIDVEADASSRTTYGLSLSLRGLLARALQLASPIPAR